MLDGDLGKVFIMESTARFGLPLLLAGQGQKEITHNEALILIDAMVSCIVERRDLELPPAGATDGRCWLVPAGASGDWSGRDGQIAISTEGGWRYMAPPDGTSIIVRESREQLRRMEGAWELAGPSGAPAAAIPLPAGGSIIDSEARAAIGTLVERLHTMGLLQPS